MAALPSHPTTALSRRPDHAPGRLVAPTRCGATATRPVPLDGQAPLRLTRAALLVAFAAGVLFAVAFAAVVLAGAFLAAVFGAALAVVRDVALTPDAFVAGVFLAVLFATVDFAVDFALDLAGAFAAAFVPVAFAVDFALAFAADLAVVDLAVVDFAAVDLVVDLVAAVLRPDALAGAESLTAFVALAATLLTAPAAFDVPAAADVLLVDLVGMSASSTASG